jgi:hypothetical protein
MLVTKDRAQRIVPPVTPVTDLEKLGQKRHEHTGESEQDKRRPAPHQTVDGVVDVCDYFNHLPLSSVFLSQFIF